MVAAEDQKFPIHAGFDFDAIADAIEDGGDGGPARGASTISQQVAKNLYLWPGRSWLRKAIEAYFTVLIETLWPKRRILEVYLNVAEFGPGVFGAGAAAQRYFGEPPSRLDRDEAARLAAVLPSPRRMHADRPVRLRARRARTGSRPRRRGSAALPTCARSRSSSGRAPPCPARPRAGRSLRAAAWRAADRAPTGS